MRPPFAAELVESEGPVGLYRDAHGLFVVRRWYSAPYLFVLVVAAIALGLCIAFAGRRTVTVDVACFLACGGFIYFSLKGVVNRTRIRVRTDGVKVTRGPVPPLGLRRRLVPPLLYLKVRHDQVRAWDGHVHNTWVVEGPSADGRDYVLDLVDDRNHAETVARFANRAMSERSA